MDLAKLEARFRYDARENILFVDGTELTDDPAVMGALIDLAMQKAIQHDRPYLVTCWRNVKLTAAGARYYTQRLPELRRVVRAIVRYAVTDPLTRANLRAAAIATQFQGGQSLLFETREEAIAAIRTGVVDRLSERPGGVHSAPNEE